MKLYKLTNEHDQTYNHTQWGEGVTHTAPGTGELCSPSYIHAYTDPLLAMLMNPIHANFTCPHLWRAEGSVALARPDKVGCTSLTTIERMKLPAITTEQCVGFAILCAQAVRHLLDDTHMETWDAWAGRWLSGKDRTPRAADAAADAATLAKRAAVSAPPVSASRARSAAGIAACAAGIAAYAARAAACGAADAACAADIDLVTLAYRAVGETP